jgi:hypothetical protein
MGGWRKLLHNLYPLLNTMTVNKSRRMRWAGHVACMGAGGGEHTEFWWESYKERDHQEDLDVGRIILKWVLEK